LPPQWRDPRISLLPVFARHSGAARISVLALALACSLFVIPHRSESRESHEAEGHAFTRAESALLLALRVLDRASDRGRKNNPRKNPSKIPLSSPSNLQNPPNPHHPNNIKVSRRWHTSFPPSRIIKSVSKTKQTRPSSRVFAFNPQPQSRSPDLVQTQSRLSPDLTCLF
jgi:hypothetical protein